MTERVYFTSDELTLNAQVVSCTAQEDGRFRVTLDRTLFHPQGGGQLADRGSIAGVQVEEVINIEGDVAHIVGRHIPVGAVEIAIDPETRALHARLHSAGHLIACVGQSLGWLPSKGHHWPGECRVVFERQSDSEPLTGEVVEEAVNALIELDAPRHLSNQEGVRSVCFGTLPLHGCGGTHVASTGVVGRIKVLKFKEKKGLLSVHYDVAQ
ncbi:alanyl-tRNA editing protein [Pantoea sp. Ap-967]|uniref:alanyl-tRNA editing protein n=1 Tax=Pantoea sp. Ap-967 TaxID=2608362 RepID=UPI0014230D42|nr:alanyl-tRNA editing protein [Pantoea sp. Ap-967]NIE74128.1 alanyl-tRNA editing protein [Pantoea sp. Ap-967]